MWGNCMITIAQLRVTIGLKIGKCHLRVTIGQLFFSLSGHNKAITTELHPKVFTIFPL